MIRKHFAKHGFNQEVSTHSYLVDEVMREIQNKSANVCFSINFELFRRHRSINENKIP